MVSLRCVPLIDEYYEAHDLGEYKTILQLVTVLSHGKGQSGSTSDSQVYHQLIEQKPSVWPTV